MLLLLSRFSRVRLCEAPEMAATRPRRPWDSPGKNAGVSDSVWPHRRQPTRLPAPGILQARTLEWGAISFSSA